MIGIALATACDDVGRCSELGECEIPLDSPLGDPTMEEENDILSRNIESASVVVVVVVVVECLVFCSVASRAAAADIPPIRTVRGAVEVAAEADEAAAPEESCVRGLVVNVGVDGELSLRLTALLEIAIRQQPSVQLELHNLGQPCPE